MYERYGEHLQAECNRILYAIREITESMGARFPSDQGNGGYGSYLDTVGDRVRSLAGRQNEGVSDASVEMEDLRSELTDEARAIEKSVEETRGTGVELRFDKLARTYDLSRTERDAFLIVLAPVFDQGICHLYGRIKENGNPILPTVDLVEHILVEMGHGTADSDSSTAPGEALSPSSPLFTYNLVERQPRDPTNPDTFDVLTVDERIVQYLKGDDSLDPALADIVSVESATTDLSEMVFEEETVDRLEAIEQRSMADSDPAIYFLSGEDGTGKDRLPSALAGEETPILRARAEDVLHEDRLTRLLREAALRDATIHLEAVESVTERDGGPDIDTDQAETALSFEADRETLTIDEIVERLDDAPGDVFLSHTESWTPDVDLADHRLEICGCPFPGQAVRQQIWAEYVEEFADDDLTSHIAMNFRLPQRDIRRAIRTARYLCQTDDAVEELDDGELPAHDASENDVFAPVDGELTREHLYDACKRYSASNLDALAEQLDPGYTWADIALNDRQESHLRELCGHLQYRGAVTSEWGFGEPGSRGDGVVALFYGQPGTGKTMAAEIIANETGLDLYRVDLSQIINKYVGETESRLATLLEEAERSNAILLFDEADSIFGKRAEVKDATDRYANTEINFLLQRLETFDGILLLTTNQRSGIDSAFKRRINHSIGFEKPQELIRRDFWKEVFPDEANVATEEFDYEFLGRILTTPALIRKVAQYAAYIAATQAHDGRPLEDGQVNLSDVTITFDHVIRALQYAREAGGAGFEVQFGPYEDRLREYDTHGVDREWDEEITRLRDDDRIADESDTRVRDADREGDESRPHPEGESSGNESTPGNQSADQVEPADGRSPEEVVREFLSRLADADDSAHDLYHSKTRADEFTFQDLRLMSHGDLSVVSEMTRNQNDPDRVILEFDQQLDGTHVPNEIDGEPLPVRYELRPESAGWRIFDITRLGKTPRRT